MFSSSFSTISFGKGIRYLADEDTKVHLACQFAGLVELKANRLAEHSEANATEPAVILIDC